MSVSPASKILERIPEPKKTGNSVVDARLRSEHTAFLQGVELLWNNPSIRGMAVSWMIDAVKQDVSGSKIDPVQDAKTASQLDDDWCAGLIDRVTEISQTSLGKAKARDRQAVKHVFEALFNCTGTTKIPEEGRAEQVLTHVFLNRASLMKRRVVALTQPAPVVSPEGIVNYGQMIYHAEYNSDGILQRLRHRPTFTVVQVEPGLNITREFKLKNNHSDMKACLRKNQLQSYPCHMFFEAEKKQGPHEHMTWSANVPEFNDACKEARDHFAAKGAQLKIAVEAEAFEAPLREKRQLQIKRTRELLAFRAENDEKRRVVVFKSAKEDELHEVTPEEQSSCSGAAAAAS